MPSVSWEPPPPRRPAGRTFQFLLGIGRPCEGVPNADPTSIDAPFHGLLEDAGAVGAETPSTRPVSAWDIPGVVVELRAFTSGASGEEEEEEEGGNYMGSSAKDISEIIFSSGTV